MRQLQYSHPFINKDDRLTLTFVSEMTFVRTMLFKTYPPPSPPTDCSAVYRLQTYNLVLIRRIEAH